MFVFHFPTEVVPHFLLKLYKLSFIIGFRNKIQPKLPGIRIALIVDVRAIPIIQRYPDECRIKTRLSGRAFVTFQSIIRETAMNFENKTKRLPETVFFSTGGKVPRLLTKKSLKEWLSYRKGTSKVVLQEPTLRSSSSLKGIKNL